MLKELFEVHKEDLERVMWLSDLTFDLTHDAFNEQGGVLDLSLLEQILNQSSYSALESTLGSEVLTLAK